MATGGGRQEMKAPGERKQNLHFYYGDAYGHPATRLIGGMVPGYSCDSAATPFMPYFTSALDALAWRTGVPESLYRRRLSPDSVKSAVPSAAICGATSTPAAAL
ncbi:integrating conjugative element protein, PFL_4710 family [Enterobacter cloacae]|uniref:Integrating conjugative element protein, PFL_4710 family n=1 Tax=Enterobacter cloacae TaxID=550 RepID=A0A377M8U3_ENTCL|nr:integrating conjugative element protein, PFL_4710 family [Enterobacter cloacae]